jgi:CDGSH iron-sulfur domain-containing protein 3
MSEPKIAQKGPYVRDEKPGRYSWCSCGHSQNQPYCDGTHRTQNTDLHSLKVEITEAKQVAWCGCKHSGTKPFCDGTHNKLP